jgi:hypothetical protein
LGFSARFLSARWEAVFGRPCSGLEYASTRWLLDLASLGLKSYKDSVYQQVAADNQFRATVEILFIVTVLYSLLVLAAVESLYLILRSQKRRSLDLLTRIVRLSSERPVESVEDVRREADSMRRDVQAVLRSIARTRWFFYPLALFLVVAIGAHFVTLARLGYVNSADAHYHQVLRVASSYLDAREQAQAEADFAQMSSREDYVRLLSRLESECKAHGRTVPKFDAW